MMLQFTLAKNAGHDPHRVCLEPGYVVSIREAERQTRNGQQLVAVIRLANDSRYVVLDSERTVADSILAAQGSGSVRDASNAGDASEAQGGNGAGETGLPRLGDPYFGNAG